MPQIDFTFFEVLSLISMRRTSKGHAFLFSSIYFSYIVPFFLSNLALLFLSSWILSYRHISYSSQYILKQVPPLS